MHFNRSSTRSSAYVKTRSDSFIQLSSSYAMLTDFNKADEMMKAVENPGRRQKLVEFIDKLKYRVEQVRAEYRQAA